MTFLSAHPIAPEIHARVQSELDRIEQLHDVRILFACESGSRGWGFASPDSDYDVRFVYAHRLDWYLRVEPQRDVIEVPISDELDISGWELRKALQRMLRSNPTLFEWFDSPVVYREDANLTARLRALAPQFFSSRTGHWHYLSMARRNFREHLQGEAVRLKKYLYVLRPLLAMQWIDAGRGMPPMRFADLAGAMVTDAGLREEINELLAIKMASGEAQTAPPFPRIHAYIAQQLDLAATEPEFLQPAFARAELDRVLYDIVAGQESRPG